MRVIWKFPIECDSVKNQPFLMIVPSVPSGAIPLCVQTQDGRAFVWMDVDPKATRNGFRLYCVGTGFGAVPENTTYLGTVQEGDYVWHLYVPKNQLT